MIEGPATPCTVPAALTMSGLFACKDANNCGCGTGAAPTIDAAELALFEAANRGSLDVTQIDGSDITDPAQRADVIKYWAHLVEGYRELYRRTCRRFHGCVLTIRCCWPAQNCTPSGRCDTPTRFTVPDLAGVFDMASSAELVSYDGGATVTPVDLPNRPPVAGALWKIDVVEGVPTIRQQKQMAADDFADWPTQDMALPCGADGTSALRIRFDEQWDPAFVAGVYHVALLDADRCSSACQCAMGDEVTSASDDGYSITLPGPQYATPPGNELAMQWRSIGFSGVSEIDDVLIRYGCRESTSQFAVTACPEPTLVREWFWGEV